MTPAKGQAAGRRHPAADATDSRLHRIVHRPALAGPRSPAAWTLAAVRLVIAAGLGGDAYVHIDLAHTYAEAGGAISEATLFQAEAAVASVTALAVILTGRRAAYVLGLAVSASALAVMIVSRYVDLGAIGPLPDLYDPVWFAEKLWAAYAEGAASLACLTGIMLTTMGRSAPGSPGAQPSSRPSRQLRRRIRVH